MRATAGLPGISIRLQNRPVQCIEVDQSAYDPIYLQHRICDVSIWNDQWFSAGYSSHDGAVGERAPCTVPSAWCAEEQGVPRGRRNKSRICPHSRLKGIFRLTLFDILHNPVGKSRKTLGHVFSGVNLLPTTFSLSRRSRIILRNVFGWQKLTGTGHVTVKTPIILTLER